MGNTTVVSNRTTGRVPFRLLMASTPWYHPEAWVRRALLVAGIGVVAQVLSVPAASIQYSGHSGAHNLYVLNVDGNAFRWGEPRYGEYVSSQSPVVIPYFDSMLAVPRSPSGANWKQAAGMNTDELLLDEAGHAYVNRITLSEPTKLLELVHPSPGRRWFRVANAGMTAALVDDAGELYELQLASLLQDVAAQPAGPLPVPNPWLAHIARPVANVPVLDVFVGYGFTLVRTAAGEIYGRGYSWEGLEGSELVPGGDWKRVIRPAGVNSWRSFSASLQSAVAVGDDGQAYYWGLRMAGTSPADPAADERIPARIDAPANLGGWRSAAVSGALVLLVSDDGRLFGFGRGTMGLQSPINFPGIALLTVATPASDPLLQGGFDSVQCGSDYVLARKTDGTDVRWGQFMRLESEWFPGDRPPEVVALPDSITDLPERLASFARVLNPANLGWLPVGEAVTLRAEVFALSGSLASVKFLINDQPLAGNPQINGNVAAQTWTATSLGQQSIKVLATDAAGRATLTDALTFTVRHAVRWTISTNTIAESTSSGLPNTAALQITRTELPYPNYHPFEFRFRLTHTPQLNEDFTVSGAVLLSDGSGDWIVTFPAGTKTATVNITAIEDSFTDPNFDIAIVPQYTWADQNGYQPPAQNLYLSILDTTVPGGPGSPHIVDDPATRYSFAGDMIPVTVSVPKSLAVQPRVSLQRPGQYFWFIPHQAEAVETLEDRWLFHFRVLPLEPGLHPIVASVWDDAAQGIVRFAASAPYELRVWDTAGLTAVRVVANEQVVREADNPMLSFTVMRDGSFSEALEVGLEVRGTALGGSDYDALPASVVIPAGTGYVQVLLQIHDDTRAELDESIYVTARQIPCAQLEGCVVADRVSTLRLKILDDDREAPAETGARVVASPFADFSYLITASGQLYAWGDNEDDRLGLGELPPELAGIAPWPRRLRPPNTDERWARVLVGSDQAFAVTTQGGLYAWGAKFPGYNALFNIPTPRPVISLPAEVEPFYIRNGLLIARQASDRLLTYQMTSYLTHQMYPVGAEGLTALLVTPQQQLLSDDGYFHDAADWQGLYADRYPLASGAGYWKDVASSGDVMIALDELGRLFRVHAGAIQYDPALGRTRRYFTTEALPALPGNRTVARLLGNELGILGLASDGSAYSLFSVVGGPPAGSGIPVEFPEGVTRWTSLAAGRSHFLAVGDDGRVYSWGSNQAGQLGDGTTEPLEAPQALPLFTNVNDPADEFPVVDLARPPVASLFGMESSYHLGGPETIVAFARAFDPDGVIERVEFLLNGEVAAEGVFDPGFMGFVAQVFVPLPGDYVLTARAWDDSGLSGDSGGIPIHVDDPGLYPIVKVWNIPSGTAEGYGFPAYFVISRQGIADVPLTVYFDIQGTAAEGSDYPALPRSVIIPAGAAEVRLPVIARPDFIDEDTEEINLTILNPGCDPDTAEPGSGCYRIGTPASAPVFIVDYLRPGDAYLPFVSLRLLNSPITREGTTNVALVEVRRYGVTVEDLAVTYSLGGTAENGVDYAPLSGVAVIPAGADSTTIAIAAIEDSIEESFERVIVTLENPGCNPGGAAIESCYLSDPNNSVIVYVGEKPVLPPLPNTVPRPVIFDDLVLFAGEGTLLGITSDPGAVFVLETSGDLVNWEPLGELINITGRVEFFDVDAANTGRRFYRLVPPSRP